MASLHSLIDIRSKNIFKRCVECQAVTTATCPVCSADEVCTLTSATCDACPVYTCTRAATSGAVDTNSTSGGHSKSSVPQIAGGIVGGIALIGIITYVIWRFVLKGKRRESVITWEPADYPMEKPGDGSDQFIRDARSRASTHTVTSMASTVLTRASNVIQIAYIPGVTNRQSENASTPNTLVPPIPPVPIPTNSTGSNDDHILFMPGDLRDSTFTDLSELDVPTRKSIAPSLARSSIASAIIKDEAVQAVSLKVKPSMVSVGSKSPTTPPVPSLDMNRFNSQNGKGPKVLIPASIENKAHTGQLKPKTVTITKKGSSSKLSLSSSAYSTTSTPILESSAETPISAKGRIISIAESQTTIGSDHARAKRSTMGEGDDEESEIEGEGSPHSRARKSMITRDRSPFADDAAIDSPTIKDSRSEEKEGPFGDDKAI